MDQILIIDKPSGPTSHDICRQVKRMLKAKKVGHAGTLDPLATGVLVVLVDGATKLSKKLMQGKKIYEFTMRLGETTDTYDCQGKILTTKQVPPNALEALKKLLPQFTGTISQVPPPFSAIKQKGQPLYKLAREGKPVTPPPRQITIEQIEIVNTSPFVRREEGGDNTVTLKVTCSCGTYVRSLAHDLGQLLGCGAHITALHRLYAEPYGIEQAKSF